MSVTALVAACGGDAGGLHALRPLGGATVIEHQLRRLAAAGAERAVLLVEEWPPALQPALRRLRDDGLRVEAVASLADVADRLAAAPYVLLLADGCLPERALLERILAGPLPAIAVLPDTAETAAFERIDAGARWAGVALLDGRRVAETAAMVGEWDPVSTLLRRLVQEHAARIKAREPPVLAEGEAAIAAAESRLADHARPAPIGWSDRFIVQPIVDALLPLLFRRSVEPGWFAVAALAATAAGGTLGLAGLRWLPLVMLLAAAPLARTAERLAGVQARATPFARHLDLALPLGLVAAATGLVHGIARDAGQWGWWLVAAAVPLALAGLAVHRRLLGTAPPLWLARAGDLPWAMLPFALAGRWGIGLAALALYATGSLGWTFTRLRERG